MPACGNFNYKGYMLDWKAQEEENLQKVISVKEIDENGILFTHEELEQL